MRTMSVSTARLPHARACPAIKLGGRQSRRRVLASPVLCTSSAVRPQPMSLHVGGTTVAFPLGAAQGQEVKAELETLLRTFAEKQAAERPRRWETMDYTYKGDASDTGDVDLLEVFCNPNAHATAFDAKVLVTMQCSGVRVTTETQLTSFKADLESFLDEC